MKKTLFFIFLTVLLSSCNNKKNTDNSSLDVSINPVGIWVSKTYSDEHGDTIPLFLKLSENGNAHRYGDYSYSGTYMIAKDTLYFDYTFDEDPVDGLQKTWFHIQNDSTLVSEWGQEPYIKISEDINLFEKLKGTYEYSRADEQGVYEFTFRIQDEWSAYANGLDELFGRIRDEEYSGYYHLERNTIYFEGHSEGDVVRYKFKIDDDNLILIENNKGFDLQPRLQKVK